MGDNPERAISTQKLTTFIIRTLAGERLNLKSLLVKETMMRDQSRADELREYLLPKTIAHAVEHSLFYQERIGKFVDKVKTLEDLRKLPILYKADVTERIDDMKTFKRFPDYLMYTSGTTGDPLEVPVYREELEASDAVLTLVREKIPDEVPLTLVVPRVGRGSYILRPHIPTIPCHINYGLDQLIYMLETTHWVDGRRVRARNLEVNVLNARQITKRLLTEGIDPSKFGLETISVSGWFLSKWERQFLQEVWGAKLMDRYGVTEVHGDAKWCDRCEYYHFFDFSVIPEVLDPDSAEPIQEGVGYMVLTGLYPYNQAIPKIRYFIGDVVEIRRTGCDTAEPGIRFLSRVKDAISAPTGAPARYRLFSTDVAELLAPLPDVARKEETTFLKFKLSSTDQGEIKIAVELVYPPQLYPSRVSELQNYFIKSLERCSKALGRPEINFVRPNELREITKV